MDIEKCDLYIGLLTMMSAYMAFEMGYQGYKEQSGRTKSGLSVGM